MHLVVWPALWILRGSLIGRLVRRPRVARRGAEPREEAFVSPRVQRPQAHLSSPASSLSPPTGPNGPMGPAPPNDPKVTDARPLSPIANEYVCPPPPPLPFPLLSGVGDDLLPSATAAPNRPPKSDCMKPPAAPSPGSGDEDADAPDGDKWGRTGGCGGSSWYGSGLISWSSWELSRCLGGCRGSEETHDL